MITTNPFFPRLAFVAMGVLTATSAGQADPLPKVDSRDAPSLARDARLRPITVLPWPEESLTHPNVAFAPFSGVFTMTTDEGEIWFCSYPEVDCEPVFEAANSEDLMAWCHVGQDRIAVSQQSRPGEIQLLKLGADRNSRWRVIGEEVIRPGGPSPWRMQYSAWSEAFILHSNQDVRLYSLRHKKTIARLKPADPAERDRAIENLQIRFSKNGRSLVTTSNPLAEFQIYRLHRADQFDALPQPLQLPGHTFLTRVLLWNEDDFLLQDLKRIRLVSPNGIIERSFREGSSFGVFDSGGGMVVGTTALLSDDQSPLPRRGVAVISGDRFEKAAEWKDQTGFCPFALSPNGRILVDQENDGVSNFATFVDVETGRHLVFPEVYLDDHTNFLFSPDGNHFITFGHSDVRVWRTPLLLLEREDGTFERRSPALR